MLRGKNRKKTLRYNIRGGFKSKAEEKVPVHEQLLGIVKELRTALNRELEQRRQRENNPDLKYSETLCLDQVLAALEAFNDRGALHHLKVLLNSIHEMQLDGLAHGLLKAECERLGALVTAGKKTNDEPATLALLEEELTGQAEEAFRALFDLAANIEVNCLDANDESLQTLELWLAHYQQMLTIFAMHRDQLLQVATTRSLLQARLQRELQPDTPCIVERLKAWGDELESQCSPRIAAGRYRLLEILLAGIPIAILTRNEFDSGLSRSNLKRLNDKGITLASLIAAETPEGVIRLCEAHGYDVQDETLYKIMAALEALAIYAPEGGYDLEKVRELAARLVR